MRMQTCTPLARGERATLSPPPHPPPGGVSPERHPTPILRLSFLFSALRCRTLAHPSPPSPTPSLPSARHPLPLGSGAAYDASPITVGSPPFPLLRYSLWDDFFSLLTGPSTVQTRTRTQRVARLDRGDRSNPYADSFSFFDFCAQAAMAAAVTTSKSKPYSFVNDYCAGMHPKILEMMVRDNMTQHVGYGLDSHCAEAARMIRQLTGQMDADVHFIPGGTQTNLIACSLALRPWEAVIATQLGHVSTHETGAIEATGHKVFTVPSPDGKLRIADIESALHENRTEHMVIPKLVYISNTTEVGTQYTKQELEAISRFCKDHGLYLFLDGARLASALSSPVNDLTLADIARLTDMFYIGATKAGGLFGEALILLNDALKPNARHLIKQRGALMAKGWLLGIQFEVLLKENLFLELGAHSNKMAAILKAGLEECGVQFAWASESNQLFPILANSTIAKLSNDFSMSTVEPLKDDTCIMRLCTSWATEEEECHRFVEVLKRLVASAA
ncbi:hypothetical protein, conserved [Leishmania tarentolae]|uniref:Aromatic amino acid beta-eliminating lyase/threonine aldolase domain-containing protein n=1 Tax=Leishmania tarentolae TaxID=5689 RepID=A0A640K6X8_LEITA|nr:hypothetical protein, conserved [Leishmania tarentolae]